MHLMRTSGTTRDLRGASAVTTASLLNPLQVARPVFLRALIFPTPASATLLTRPRTHYNQALSYTGTRKAASSLIYANGGDTTQATCTKLGPRLNSSLFSRLQCI